MGIEKTAELIREKVGNNKVMVTFDIDFVDPAFAPGTGTPVSCGFTSRQALELVEQVNIDVAKEYFEKAEKTEIPKRKVRSKLDKLLREFILSGGFEISTNE